MENIGTGLAKLLVASDVTLHRAVRENLRLVPSH
jgi:hypothetical protein